MGCPEFGYRGMMMTLLGFIDDPQDPKKNISISQMMF